MESKATSRIGDQSHEYPTMVGTEDAHAIDVRNLRAESGWITYDHRYGKSSSSGNSSPTPNLYWRIRTCLCPSGKTSLILTLGVRCLNIPSRCLENAFFECFGAQVFGNCFACFLESREIPQIGEVSALLGFDRLDAAFVILQKNA